MNWKRNMDLAATLLAVLISLFAIRSAFANRLTGSSRTRPLEMSTAYDLMSPVREFENVLIGAR